MFSIGVSVNRYLLSLVEACVTDTGACEATILRSAGAHRATLRRVRAGRGCNSNTIDKILGAVALEYGRAAAMRAGAEKEA